MVWVFLYVEVTLTMLRRWSVSLRAWHWLLSLCWIPRLQRPLYSVSMAVRCAWKRFCFFVQCSMEPEAAGKKGACGSSLQQQDLNWPSRPNDRHEKLLQEYPSRREYSGLSHQLATAWPLIHGNNTQRLWKKNQFIRRFAQFSSASMYKSQRPTSSHRSLHTGIHEKTGRQREKEQNELPTLFFTNFSDTSYNTAEAIKTAPHILRTPPSPPLFQGCPRTYWKCINSKFLIYKIRFNRCAEFVRKKTLFSKQS